MRKNRMQITAVILCLVLMCYNFTALSAGASNKTITSESTSKTGSTHLSIKASNDGKDLYSPATILFTGVGYRYGPSIIKNCDGTRDIFLAAPGTQGEWDWITYRHFNEKGENTNGEKAVLQPTPDSDDIFSTCDPGVIFFGGYYYIAYTSTKNPDAIDNNVFVARSKKIDGPYEKWNGKGWGGNPKSIVEYTGPTNNFGAGEPSLILIGDKLYMYYTYTTESGDVRLSIADSTNENWPATLKYVDTVFSDTDDRTDSVDVKYIDKYKKFIAICTANRMTESSSIELYESDDGVTFELCSILKTNIAWYCHNAGIEGNLSGHIENPDNVMIGYAYGKKWGAWSLRLQTITISSADSIDLSGENGTSIQQKNDFDWLFLRRDFIGITTAKRTYNVSLSDGTFKVKFKKVNKYTMKVPLLGEVSISDYDKSIINVDGKKITPLKKGSTLVSAEWNGYHTTFLINVT